MPASCDAERAPLLSQLPKTGAIRAINVYSLVHEIHEDVKQSIDTSLSFDALNAPDVSFNVLRPLTERYSSKKNHAIVYALLLNRLQFLRLSETDLSFSTLQRSRADLCEILSIKLIRTFAASDLELVDVVTRPWNPFQGAPASVTSSLDMDDVEEEMKNTLDLAIASSAKRFLSTPLLQRVIDIIASGAIVYRLTSSSKRALLGDSYRSKRIRERDEAEDDDDEHVVYQYSAHAAGWLDHTRLRVPRYRDMLEFINFTLLVITFVICLRNATMDKMHVTEVVFCLFAFGLAFDEFASTKEHGFLFYTQSLFNGFDIIFVCLFFAYFAIRLRALATHDAHLSVLAFDTLACSATVLFPRLAFSIISGNAVLIALKKMVADFTGFLSFAVICFSGIFYSLLWLGGDSTPDPWTAKKLLWLMSQIWFGSSYLSFSNSASFHPVFGPVLLILYAALSNTLLITILISILSNRYAEISSNAKEEQAFQAAVATVGGVKNDSVFSFPIPLNIPAFLILGPLRLVTSPRQFHLLNSSLIRLTTFPLLISISVYERWTLRKLPTAHLKAASTVENLLEALTGSGSDWIEDVFAESPLVSSLSVRSQDLEREISGMPSSSSALNPTTLLQPTTSISNSPPRKPTALPPTMKATSSPQLRRIDTSSSAAMAPSSPSPLARLFARSAAPAPTQLPPSLNVIDEDGHREILRSELEDLAQRQIRIEALLLSLSKGLRSESIA